VNGLGRSALPWLVGLAVSAGSCGKSQPATVLLTVRNGAASVPDEVRLTVYGRAGLAFPETRLPSQGTLMPVSASVLGTIVIYVKESGKEVRLQARGLSLSATSSQGTVRGTPEPGQQIALDLVLQQGVLVDADSDGVSDSIDNCVYVSNSFQEDGDEDGVGDACAGSDAGAFGGAHIGSACTIDLGCDSHQCVDGYCCDTPCAEPCYSCSLPGLAGTCTAIAAGQDSQGDCPVEPVASCGRTGKCLAGGTCALYRDGDVCSAAACVDSSQSSAQTCDGAGACRPAVVTACGIYACSGPACATSCSTDAQCAAGYYCAAPTCLPKLDVGVVCGGSNQCTTGFCADGVCCAGACSGPCQSCASPVIGTCTSYAAGTDPDADCPQGLACTGAGACYPKCTQDSPDCEAGYYCAAGACAPKKDLGAACGATNECKSGFCTDGVCCGEACTETCKSCNLTGSVGSCAFVPANSRDTTGPNPCGPPNRCDGAGVCQ
jgi:hypothetical protein